MFSPDEPGKTSRPKERVDFPEASEVEFEPRPVRLGEALTAAYAILAERYASGESDVAARHNEHQP